MANTISTQQLGQLATEMSNMTGLPKAVCQQQIEQSIALPAVVIPFNTDAMPLNTTAALSMNFATPATSPAQTIIQKSRGKTSASITAGTGETLYTVTAGKTLYITALSVDNLSGAANSFEIRDGGSGGTVIIGARNGNLANAEQNFRQTFPTPLKFTTDVWLDVAATANHIWAFSGFEV